MKRLFIIITLIFLCASFAHAEDRSKWTWTDTGLQGTFYIISAMDMSQTLKLSRNYNEGVYERNPILGRHPPPAKIISYYILGLAAHTYIAYKLDRPYRTIWQSLWIAIEFAAVQHNRSSANGLGIQFHF